MKKAKTYQQYLAENKTRHDNIMRKYGAPPEAKPPGDKDVIPAASDRHYRKYALTYKRRLEQWPKSERTYP